MVPVVDIGTVVVGDGVPVGEGAPEGDSVDVVDGGTVVPPVLRE
jgi:hypothetical protein